MTSQEIRAFFEGRREEVSTYLDLMRNVDVAGQQGYFQATEGMAPISPLQQQILYANLFVQLYNLVEATITRCLEGLHMAACDSSADYKPADLAAPLLREWVRFTARTHTDRAYEKRLDAALEMAEHLIHDRAIGSLAIESGGGGNWDDDAIELVAARVGCDLVVAEAIRTAAKRHVRDDLGALALVRVLRNNLAHGSMSFGECGAGVTVSDLESIANCVLDYLDAVVASFVRYLDDRHFLATPATIGDAT